MAQNTITAYDPTTLLHQLAERDERAWRYAVDAFRPCVIAQALRYRLDANLREDLLQRVWLALLENADQIRNPACLPGWLAATARHEALRLVRRQRREVSIGSPSEDDPPRGTRSLWATPDQPDVDAALLSAERIAVLDDALNRLPPRQRAVLGELLDGESSYQAISVRLGIPIGSIGPTRMRAIRQLRQRICA